MIRKIFEISIVKTILFNYTYCIRRPYDGIPKWSDFIKLPFVVSKNVKIMGGLKGTVRYSNKNKVTIGFGNISIFDKSKEKTIWNNHGAISFLGCAHIGQGARINNHGEIVFGDFFGLSANSTIDCDKSIVFGKNVLLSWDILIMDHDVHTILDLDSGKQVNQDEPISIGDDVWIGCRCTILKGTRIGDNVVVAAESTLTSPIGAQNAIIGNYGKELKSNILWER